MIKETKDRLTDLYVQKYFEGRLDEEIARARRYKHALTLLLFQINYEFFIPENNIRWMMIYTIFREFGNILRNNIRNVDLPARYKTEEFVVVLPETPLEGAKIVAERIRNDMANHLFEGYGVYPKVRVAVDGGIASFPIHGKSRKELVTSAEAALFRSVELGGNCIAECPQILYNADYTPFTGEEQKQASAPEVPVAPATKSMEESGASTQAEEVSVVIPETSPAESPVPAAAGEDSPGERISVELLVIETAGETSKTIDTSTSITEKAAEMRKKVLAQTSEEKLRQVQETFGEVIKKKKKKNRKRTKKV